MLTARDIKLQTIQAGPNNPTDNNFSQTMLYFAYVFPQPLGYVSNLGATNKPAFSKYFVVKWNDFFSKWFIFK